MLLLPAAHDVRPFGHSQPQKSELPCVGCHGAKLFPHASVAAMQNHYKMLLHSFGGRSNFVTDPDGKASSKAASVFRPGNINIKKNIAS
jgi:hypothetical protein